MATEPADDATRDAMRAESMWGLKALVLGTFSLALLTFVLFLLLLFLTFDARRIALDHGRANAEAFAALDAKLEAKLAANGEALAANGEALAALDAKLEATLASNGEALAANGKALAALDAKLDVLAAKLEELLRLSDPLPP